MEADGAGRIGGGTGKNPSLQAGKIDFVRLVPTTDPV
jgi:hypothetical protein